MDALTYSIMRLYPYDVDWAHLVYQNGQWENLTPPHDAARFPHTCPKCKAHCYIGLNQIDHELPVSDCR